MRGDFHAAHADDARTASKADAPVPMPILMARALSIDVGDADAETGDRKHPGVHSARVALMAGMHCSTPIRRK